MFVSFFIITYYINIYSPLLHMWLLWNWLCFICVLSTLDWKSKMQTEKTKCPLSSSRLNFTCVFQELHVCVAVVRFPDPQHTHTPKGWKKKQEQINTLWFYKELMCQTVSWLGAVTSCTEHQTCSMHTLTRGTRATFILHLHLHWHSPQPPTRCFSGRKGKNTLSENSKNIFLQALFLFFSCWKVLFFINTLIQPLVTKLPLCAFLLEQWRPPLLLF